MPVILGTLTNSVAIIGGTLVGLLIGKRFQERYRLITTYSLGLIILLAGIQMAIQVQNFIVLTVSMVLGGLLGEWWNIEQKLEKIAEKMQLRVKAEKGRFVYAFVSTTLLYCVGSMAILGPIEEVTKGQMSILQIKSALDGITSIAFASAFGIGVLFSAFSVLIYQGSIALFTYHFGNLLNDTVLHALNATGGLLLITLAFNFLQLGKIKVGNLLPALPVAIGITLLFPS